MMLNSVSFQLQAYLILAGTMEKMDSAFGGLLGNQKELKLKSCSND